MDGVDAALQPLQPVAPLHHLVDAPVGLRHLRPLELGHRRLQLGRAHVDPDDVAHLRRGVGGDLHLVLEVALGGLGGHVDAVAVHVELPAVVDAAQPGLLVAAEEEAGATVRAVVVDDAHDAIGVAECDELLAQQLQSHGGAVGIGQLPVEQSGDPESPHHVAGEGPGANLRQGIVLLDGQHCLLLARYQSDAGPSGAMSATWRGPCSAWTLPRPSSAPPLP